MAHITYGESDIFAFAFAVSGSFSTGVLEGSDTTVLETGDGGKPAASSS